ncbi:MAG: hypothetical protein ABI675_05220 [Chitinophagaceae bacterium]
MKKIVVLLVVPVYLLLVAGFTCNNPAVTTGEPGNASFWKKSATAETHYLYIDNMEKGVLPFIPGSPTPGSDIMQKQGLSVILKPGNYDIVVKDSIGNILCEGTLYLKRTENSKEIKASWKNDQCMLQVAYN